MPVHCRIMTLNLRVSHADDGPNAWRYRWPGVRALLREVQPHIFGAQECLPDQLVALTAELHDYINYPGPDAAIFTEQHPIRNPLFVHQRAPRPRQQGIIPLNETGVLGQVSWDGREGRLAHWLRFPGWTLVNTHFDAWDNPQARRESARLIVDFLAGSPTAVVIGDLNCGPESEPLAVFRAAGFTLAKDLALPQDVDRRTFHKFTGRGLAELDYVLVRGAAVQSVTIPRPQEVTPYLSDHDPLVVEVAFDSA